MRVHKRDGEGAPPFEGIVTVIGLGGMFIRTPNTEAPGTILSLHLDDPVAAFDFECTVRHITENGMGVEITSIFPQDEQRLRFLLVQFKGATHT